MNRREMLQAITGTLATAGASGSVQAVDAEPPPHVLANIRAQFEEMREGHPPCPVVILRPGVDVRFERDPGAK